MLPSLRHLFALLLISLLSISCSTTLIKAAWKDPSYQSKPAKILVVGISKNPLNRRLFEDEFALQLRGKGTEAIASHTILPDNQQDDQAAIATKVKELNADTVLITRLVSKKTEKAYVPGTPLYPPYYGTWPDYYGYSFNYMYSPGYVTESEYAIMETNLYETIHDKLVWAASSETLATDSDKKLIKAYIGVMVNAMVKDGLFGK